MVRNIRKVQNASVWKKERVRNVNEVEHALIDKDAKQRTNRIQTEVLCAPRASSQQIM